MKKEEEDRSWEARLPEDERSWLAQSGFAPHETLGHFRVYRLQDPVYGRFYLDKNIARRGWQGRVGPFSCCGLKPWEVYEKEKTWLLEHLQKAL